MSIAEFLFKVNGFNSLPVEDLEGLAGEVVVRRFEPGDYLIRRGAMGDTMHVLREGRVRVPLVDAGGRQKMVVHLGPTDVIGEMALLTGDKRTADVIAETVVETLELARETVEPLLRENPPLARFLTEILGRRLEEQGGISDVGKYRLIGKIGEGATSKVYQGVHPTLNRLVAIKMLSHALVYDRTFRDRFLQEARTIAGLTHPNIVQIYDTEEAYATYFIVMEKVPGDDLQKLLRQRKIIEPKEAMSILGQMAAALSYAHGKGIVHRDVKPANCSVDSGGLVKLMDFGIARRIPRKKENKRAKIVEGTPRYLAPEAAVGRPVDGRADIYSLGIMAFEMVTGRVPFYSETIRELLQMHVRKRPPNVESIRSGLPSGLIKFINGTLIKRPDERLTDWTEIRRLLDVDTMDRVPELRSRNAHREVISLDFTDQAEAEVRREVDGFLARVSAMPGVDVGHGRVTAVTIGPDGLSRPARGSSSGGWRDFGGSTQHEPRRAKPPVLLTPDDDDDDDDDDEN